MLDAALHATEAQSMGTAMAGPWVREMRGESNVPDGETPFFWKPRGKLAFFWNMPFL